MAIVLVMFIFSGCKEYEEGPAIFLRSSEKRLTNTWVVDGVFIDGEEQEDAKDAYEGYSITYEKDESVKVNGVDTKKFWILQDDILTVTNASSTSQEVNKIVRLTSKQLWLQELESTTVIHYVRE